MISDEPDVAYALEVGLPHDLRIVRERRSSDTEGHGVGVVVIANQRPLIEVSEVRVHPTLWDKPVIVFAPSGMLERRGWALLDIHIVDEEMNALEELFSRVLTLMDGDTGASPHTNGDRNHPG